MSTVKTFKLCFFVAVLAFLLLTTGCAGFNRYMKDRGNDFLDCFNLQAGWGLIADAEVRVTDYISTGAGFAMGMKWGMKGRYLVGFGDLEGIDMHVGLPFTPFIWLLEGPDSQAPLNPLRRNGALKFLCTDVNVRYGSWIVASRGPQGPVHERYYENNLECRNSHKSILVFDLTCFPRYRDNEKVEIAVGIHRQRRRTFINAFDVEVGATLGLSARVGFSPGQLADFLLGWLGLDIGDDDDQARRLQLYEAVGKKDEQAVKKLIADGVKVNTYIMEEGATPLHNAVAWENMGIIRLLLENGANPNKGDNEGRSALHWAPTRGIAELMIAEGANIEVRDNSGQTPLHCVCTDVAKLLIELGANIRARDVYGATPLYLAACGYKDDVELVKALVDAGADVNAKTPYGWAPLHEACRLGYTEAVKVLVSNGAEIDIRTKDGQTPLHLAVSYRMRKKAIVEFLISAGADVNARDDESRTPLDNIYGDEELGQLLRGHGAKPGK